MNCPDCGSTNLFEVISGFYCRDCENETGEENFTEYTEEMFIIEDEYIEDYE